MVRKRLALKFICILKGGLTEIVAGDWMPASFGVGAGELLSFNG